jgi:hypothetical protein
VRHIKLVVISFVVLFIIVTLISLLIPSHVTISKAIHINATREKVMEQLADPVKWKNWYPGADSAAFIYANSKIVGILSSRHSLTGLIITGKTDSSVTAVNSGLGAKDISLGWNLIAGASPGVVSVQWHMDFKLHWYPWEKFASLLFEKQYGVQMEQGLGKLKKLVETN